MPSRRHGDSLTGSMAIQKYNSGNCYETDMSSFNKIGYQSLGLAECMNLLSHYQIKSEGIEPIAKEKQLHF